MRVSELDVGCASLQPVQEAGLCAEFAAAGATSVIHECPPYPYMGVFKPMCKPDHDLMQPCLWMQHGSPWARPDKRSPPGSRRAGASAVC